MTSVDGNAGDFEYDIAFSFLAEDEMLATQLNDLLQDRFKTFLYSKQQEKLAGTDGEEHHHPDHRPDQRGRLSHGARCDGEIT